MNCPACGKKMTGKGRSNAQNRYFHGQILPILSDHTGYTEEEMKDIVKSKFLKNEFVLETKEGFVIESNVVQGSSEISTARFEQFMEDIRRWASKDLGVVIPLPNEPTYEAN